MDMTAALHDVELRHLAALRAVAEEGTFGRAAQRLGFTQSAVSQQIASLERLVGDPLFDRPGGPRAVRLTPVGQVLLRHAVEILDRMRAAEADLTSYRSAETGRLNVGTYQSVSVRVLPALLARLRVERPGVQVELMEDDDQTCTTSRLHGGELDLAFVVAPFDADGLDVTMLGTDPFVVISPRDAPLTEAGPVPVDALVDEPLIGQHTTPCQTQIEAGLRRHGLEPNVVFRTGDNAAVQAMVRSGMGHAVMPLLALDRDDPGVVIRELDPPIPPRGIALASVSGRILPPAADVFRSLALDCCGELLGR